MLTWTLAMALGLSGISQESQPRLPMAATALDLHRQCVSQDPREQQMCMTFLAGMQAAFRSSEYLIDPNTGQRLSDMFCLQPNGSLGGSAECLRRLCRTGLFSMDFAARHSGCESIQCTLGHAGSSQSDLAAANSNLSNIDHDIQDCSKFDVVHSAS